MWLVGAVDNKESVIVELGPTSLIPAAWGNNDWSSDFFVAKFVVVDIFLEEFRDSVLVVTAGGDEEIFIHNHHVGAAVGNIGFDKCKCRLDSGEEAVFLDFSK